MMMESSLLLFLRQHRILLMKVKHSIIYVDKVIRREDMIYFLRKDRNVPYVTIEVKDKKVTQIEGDMNNRFISKGSPEYEAIKELAALNKFGIL